MLVSALEQYLTSYNRMSRQVSFMTQIAVKFVICNVRTSLQQEDETGFKQVARKKIEATCGRALKAYLKDFAMNHSYTKLLPLLPSVCGISFDWHFVLEFNQNKTGSWLLMEIVGDSGFFNWFLLIIFMTYIVSLLWAQFAPLESAQIFSWNYVPEPIFLIFRNFTWQAHTYVRENVVGDMC